MNAARLIASGLQIDSVTTRLSVHVEEICIRVGS